MAKKAKKTLSKTSKLFKGDLPTIRKAINAVAKEVEAGQKKAQAEVAKGLKANPGSPARNNLAANQQALKKANELLEGLTKAKKSVADLCCNNDQGCNFLVLLAKSTVSR